MLALLFSCNRNPINLREIRIEIDENNNFFVNGEHIKNQNLQDVLSELKAKAMKSGIDESELNVYIKLDKKAKIGAFSSLQVILRKLNFRKITYVDDQEQVTI